MIDIYSDVIDNYGDMAFAVKLMNTYFFEKKESSFRLFSNNQEVFEIFQPSLLKGIECEYHSLSEIPALIPNTLIMNLFERTIEYPFLTSFDFPIHLINYSYFSLEPDHGHFSPGIKAIHGKISHEKNLTIEQFAVSLLPGTGGVFSEKVYAPLLEKEYLREKYHLDGQKKWISVFCYPETLALLLEQGFLDGHHTENILFLFFGKAPDGDIGSYRTLPFLTMNEYRSLVHACDANIVRGENSLISALESGKSFYWDIYKESNNAHQEKLEDFTQYLRKNRYGDSLIEAQLQGNNQHNFQMLKSVFFEK